MKSKSFLLKTLKYFRHPSLIMLKMDDLGIIRISDKLYLKIKYLQKMNKKLCLKNPKTFNEKLQWLKLYDRNENYSKMVDKYDAKEYVASIIGSKYIIPTLGVYDNFDEIDFTKLPKQFVIKCTHDSGGLVIVKDKAKMHILLAKEKINQSLQTNYYYFGREWPYKYIKPRIIIEKYMEDVSLKELRDYKFFCFNGKVKFFKIDFNRFSNHRANYYDINGKLLKFGELLFPPDYNKKIQMPINLELMIQFAEKLSKNIPFLRVDFYEVNGNLYFGELTFYPANGFGKFSPESWDEKLGDLIDLNVVKK